MFVKVENLANSQIIQQVNGFADITVKGTVEDYVPDPAQPGAVMVGIFRENNLSCVIPYTFAEMDGNRFTVTLKDVPAGGLYTLRTKYSPFDSLDCDLNGEVIHHIGVGDIWVIAGQSNAVGYGKTPVVNVPDPRVRLFSLRGFWRDGTVPLHDDFTTEGFLTGCSPFVSFANELVDALNYPIGLIQTAWGGTPIEAWAKGQGLYNRMMECIQKAGGKVKGIAWHQGCSDADSEKADKYLERFTQLVKDVRADLNDPDLPFVTCQLNKFVALYDGEADHCFGKVKDAQRRAAHEIPNVFVTVSHDLPLVDFVHNNGVANEELGHRMGWLALESVYGKKYLGHAPEASKLVYSGKTLTITFDHVYMWFMQRWAPAKYFDLVLEDDAGELTAVNAKCVKNQWIVEMDREVEGKLLCSYAPWRLNNGLMPYDFATGMPPLSFYRMEVACE